MEEPKRTLADGSPVTPDHREIDPQTGLQKDHFPVGADGEFTWDGTDEKVGT
jgi:hypothetical protein